MIERVTSSNLTGRPHVPHPTGSHYRRQLTLQASCVYASIATVAPSWVDIALVPAFQLFAFLRVHQYAEDLILWLVQEEVSRLHRQPVAAPDQQPRVQSVIAWPGCARYADMWAYCNVEQLTQQLPTTEEHYIPTAPLAHKQAWDADQVRQSSAQLAQHFYLRCIASVHNLLQASNQIGSAE